ncbi:MAG: hypothetical protein QNK03_27845 [Myxococcota bacterium]|nr:hypothetical protein [Myxococcota bacterium]
MGHRIDCKTILGASAVVAMLLLSSPGVRWARAEPAADPSQLMSHAPLLPLPSEGPSCRANPVPARQQAARLANLYEDLAQAVANDPVKDEIVVLNGQGYNYGAPPTTDPALLRFELNQD